MDAKLALIPALPDILHLLRMKLDPPPELPKLSDYAPRSLLIRWKKIFCASCNKTPTPRSGRKSLIDRGLEGLETRLEAYLSLFAPIRKLPAEILLEIFAFDLVLDERDQDAMAVLAQVPVRNLAQVCASWRALVNANPTLWNTVTIPGRPSISPSLYQQFHLTMQRTAAAPLNINAMRLTSEWVPHLVDGISRWRHVRLTTTTGVLENLRSVAIGKLFLLESFTLVDFSRPAPGCLDLLVGAPRLTKLSLTGSLVAHVPLELIQHLHNLKCICYPEDLSTTLDAITRLPSTSEFELIVLSTSNSAWETDSELSGEDNEDSELLAISSPITSITLQTNQKADAEQVIAALTLCNLSGLKLACAAGGVRAFLPGATGEDYFEWMYDPNEHDTPTFPFHIQLVALAQRSSFTTHLRSLDLVQTPIFLDHLLELLVLLSSLEVLAIADFPLRPYPLRLVNNALFRALTVGEDTGHGAFPKALLVPRLSRLWLHSILVFDDDVLMAFLRFRAPSAGVPIDQFQCHIRALAGYWRQMGKIRPDVGAAIANLTRQGNLRLSWTQLSGQNRRAGAQEGDEEYA